MKNSTCFKGFAVSAIVLVMCVFQIQADPPNLVPVSLGGSGGNMPINVCITPGVPDDPNNPNQFPVVFLETAVGFYGFLLDGSELSKAWLERLEIARANNSIVRLYYDSNSSNALSVPISVFGPFNAVGKIWYLSTSSVVFE